MKHTRTSLLVAFLALIGGGTTDAQTPSPTPGHVSKLCGSADQMYQYYWCGRERREKLSHEDEERARDGIKRLAGSEGEDRCKAMDSCSGALPECKLNHIVLQGRLDLQVSR